MCFLGKLKPARVGERRAGPHIKLTRVNVEYTVSAINNRDSHMISKKISLRSPFPFIRGYAASFRIARC
jgi:NADPH:quinone reductase-like Zn-dependent oxidoreductase